MSMGYTNNGSSLLEIGITFKQQQDTWSVWSIWSVWLGALGLFLLFSGSPILRNGLFGLFGVSVLSGPFGLLGSSCLCSLSRLSGLFNCFRFSSIWFLAEIYHSIVFFNPFPKDVLALKPNSCSALVVSSILLGWPFLEQWGTLLLNCDSPKYPKFSHRFQSISCLFLHTCPLVPDTWCSSCTPSLRIHYSAVDSTNYYSRDGRRAFLPSADECLMFRQFRWI